MSFAESLLDGWDVLAKRNEGANRSLTDMAEIFRNVAKIERSYAQGLKKVASGVRASSEKQAAASKEVGWVL